MEYQNLLVDHPAPAVGRITVNRPQAMNALNGQTMDELYAAVEALSAEEELRVILVTGAGEKAFVAGADIKAMVDLDEPAGAAFAAVGHKLGDAMERSPKIIIAVVNGVALGGGTELALACDFIYAADHAKFGQPEVNLGVIPGFGGTTRLPRRVGIARAVELVTTGEIIKADEALRIGLVNKVFPAAEVMNAALATAATIAKKGPFAVAAAKRSLRASLQTSLAENNAVEIEAFGSCFATTDQKEGMRAFIEKRPAVFTGR